MVGSLKSWLVHRYSKPILIGVNLLISFCVFIIASKTEFPDEKGYLLMAESFGTDAPFSSWYFLDNPPAETLRTWGYPFFIFLVQTIFESTATVKVLQFLAHIGSILIFLKLIRFWNKDETYKLEESLFLILTAVNIQLPYYSGLISAESINIFFVALYSYWLFCKQRDFVNALILGIIAFVNFQIRPAFLLLPFLIALVELVLNFDLDKLKFYAYHVGSFSILLFPFGLWNQHYHDTFKVTPLEGGAGVAHMGYWGFKLPKNYQENFYWSNNVGDDPFMNLVADRSEEHAVEFEREWESILNECSSTLLRKDSSMLDYMENHNPGIFLLYNSAFTKKREELLVSRLLDHIREEPWFYAKTRMLTAARVWFTGVNVSNMEESSMAVKLKLIIPFMITFVFIFCGLLYITFYSLRNKEFRNKYLMLIALILYFGLSHVFFAVQARYTVVVHFQILLLVATIFGTRMKCLSKNFDLSSEKCSNQ